MATVPIFNLILPYLHIISTVCSMEKLLYVKLSLIRISVALSILNKYHNGHKENDKQFETYNVFSSPIKQSLNLISITKQDSTW